MKVLGTFEKKDIHLPLGISYHSHIAKRMSDIDEFFILFADVRGDTKTDID